MSAPSNSNHFPFNYKLWSTGPTTTKMCHCSNPLILNEVHWHFCAVQTAVVFGKICRGHILCLCRGQDFFIFLFTCMLCGQTYNSYRVPLILGRTGMWCCIRNAVLVCSPRGFMPARFCELTQIDASAMRKYATYKESFGYLEVGCYIFTLSWSVHYDTF